MYMKMLHTYMYVCMYTYLQYVCQPYYTLARTYVVTYVYMSVHCYDSVHTVQYMYKCVRSTNVVYQVPTYQGIH